MNIEVKFMYHGKIEILMILVIFWGKISIDYCILVKKNALAQGMAERHLL